MRIPLGVPAPPVRRRPKGPEVIFESDDCYAWPKGQQAKRRCIRQKYVGCCVLRRGKNLIVVVFPRNVEYAKCVKPYTKEGTKFLFAASFKIGGGIEFLDFGSKSCKRQFGHCSPQRNRTHWKSFVTDIVGRAFCV